jgi:hypothetical protein
LIDENEGGSVSVFGDRALHGTAQSVILKLPGERVMKKTISLMLPLLAAACWAQDAKRPPITGVAHI